MSRAILLTRPEHDDTTHYLSNWSIEFIDLAEKRNFNVYDLKGKKAIRKQVEGHLSSNPSLVIFNGHGDVNVICGYLNEPLIILGKNEGYLKSKIVYARSCKSAEELGRKSQALAYISYKEDLIFFYEPKKITKPLTDETAKMFLEPTNKLVTSLIKGNTVAESQKRSRELYIRTIKGILSSETSNENTSLVKYIWWNLKNQTVIGSENAKVED